MALATAGAEGRALWLEWSATSEKFEPHEAEAKWASFKPGGTHWKSVFVKAKDAGWSGESARAEPVQPASISNSFLVCAEDIEEEVTEWAWHHRLPKGALTLIAGMPATGKSTLAFSLAATISNGGKWPDDTDAPRGKVVIWSGEDSVATIRARLRVMGADLKNVFIVNGTRIADNGNKVVFDIREHMPPLAEEIETLGDVAMVIVDPIISMVTGDAHKSGDVRQGLQPLIDLLNKTGAVGVGITHFSKNTSGRHALDRVTGSLAFGAAPRMVWCTVAEPAAPGARAQYRVVMVKSSLGPEGMGGYSYTFGREGHRGQGAQGRGHVHRGVLRWWATAICCLRRSRSRGARDARARGLPSG